jgi:hypothetical protein
VIRSRKNRQAGQKYVQRRRVMLTVYWQRNPKEKYNLADPGID